MLTEFPFTEYLIDGKKTVYFRGRKLHGRVVKLPRNYQGSFLRVTDTTAASKVSDNRRRQVSHLEEDEEMDDGEEQVEEKLAEELATFEEFTVWDHEALPAAAEDPYVMSIEEWFGFADAVCSGSTGRRAFY